MRLLGLAALVAIAVFRLPLAWIVIGLGLLGWGLARWRVAVLDARAAHGEDPTMNTLPAGDLLALFLHFLTLSLLSIGGAMSTAPEMQRYFVVERGWIGEADFTTAIALAQAAPGPNVLSCRCSASRPPACPAPAAALVGILLPSTLLSLG